jgi:hypothetical protein
MEIIVQLKPEYAERLRAAAASDPVLRGLRSILRRLNAQLEPLHPGNDDPTLAAYFRVHPVAGDPQAIVQRLLRSKAVEAAYVKPAGEAPA